MNPSGMRGLIRLQGAIAMLAASGMLVTGAPRHINNPISDSDFIDSYNALEPEPWPALPEPKHRARTKGHNQKHVAAYERPPLNTRHELDARERRYEHKNGSSLLDKARRAKGRI